MWLLGDGWEGVDSCLAPWGLWGQDGGAMRISPPRLMFAGLTSGSLGRVVSVSALLLCLPLEAGEAEDAFSRKFRDGFEPALLLADHGSEDGAVSMICSARKKGLKAADWPSIMEDVSINETEVDEDAATMENWIVSLKEKKRLGVVKSTQEGFRTWYPGQNHHELSALWGPDQEGWRYGVLNYTGRWACNDIFFVNIDGTDARVTSMRGLLDRATAKAITAEKKDPESYEISYELMEFVNPEASVSVSDSLVLKLRYIAQVPKEDEEDVIEGTHTVTLSRDAKGLATATLPGPAAGGAKAAPAKAAGVPTDEEFDAFREKSRAAVQAGTWKAVKKNQPPFEKGRKKFVTGWLSGNVIQQLTWVDSRGDDDEEISTYFWRDGILVSISKYATGSHTGKKDLPKKVDTFNFHEGRLVSWTRLPGGVQDPEQAGFQDLGAVLQKEAVFRSEPIYEAIGAD